MSVSTSAADSAWLGTAGTSGGCGIASMATAVAQNKTSRVSARIAFGRTGVGSVTVISGRTS